MVRVQIIMYRFVYFNMGCNMGCKILYILVCTQIIINYEDTVYIYIFFLNVKGEYIIGRQWRTNNYVLVAYLCLLNPLVMNFTKVLTIWQIIYSLWYISRKASCYIRVYCIINYIQWSNFNHELQNILFNWTRRYWTYYQFKYLFPFLGWSIRFELRIWQKCSWSHIFIVFTYWSCSNHMSFHKLRDVSPSITFVF